MQEQSRGNQMILQLVYRVLILVVEGLVTLLVVVGIIFCCQKSYQFCYEIFGSVSVEEAPGQNKDFQVKENDNMYRVAKRLSQEKLIANRYSFYVRTTLMEQDQIRLRPGSYVLNTSMDYEEIINELTMSE